MKHGSASHQISIRSAVSGDASAISRLLRSLSHTYIVSPDDPEVDKFLATLSEGAILKFIERRELAGAAAMSGGRRLAHLFVDPSYQGIGLGRDLWEHLRNHALRSGNPGLFEVNSSLSAAPVYERFGFVIAGPKVERHGGAYVPMILDLAASQ
jgi:GNAT superfamily N-acetyltransferase